MKIIVKNSNIEISEYPYVYEEVSYNKNNSKLRNGFVNPYGAVLNGGGMFCCTDYIDLKNAKSATAAAALANGSTCDVSYYDENMEWLGGRLGGSSEYTDISGEHYYDGDILIKAKQLGARYCVCTGMGSTSSSNLAVTVVRPTVDEDVTVNP